MTSAQEVIADSIADQVSGVLIKGKQREELAIAHRQWWEDNQNRLQWDPLTGRFNIK
jgi:hypothetical protein